MVDPRRVHLITVKHMLKYLEGTIVATQIQIGPVMSLTGRAPQDVASA